MRSDDKAEVASRLGGVERGVVYFGSLLSESMSSNSLLEELRVEGFCSHSGTGLTKSILEVIHACRCLALLLSPTYWSQNRLKQRK